MNNVKLNFNEMKEMVELFVHHKLNALKVGDFELQKSYYESKEKEQTSKESPLFYSGAPQLPVELQEELALMMSRK